MGVSIVVADKLMNIKYSADVTSQNGIDTELSGAAMAGYKRVKH